MFSPISSFLCYIIEHCYTINIGGSISNMFWLLAAGMRIRPWLDYVPSLANIADLPSRDDYELLGRLGARRLRGIVLHGAERFDVRVDVRHVHPQRADGSGAVALQHRRALGEAIRSRSDARARGDARVSDTTV